MNKRVKGLRSSAGGAFGALNEGEERDLDAAIADDLIASGAAEWVADVPDEKDAAPEAPADTDAAKPTSKRPRKK